MKEINLQEVGESFLKEEENIIKNIIIKGCHQEDLSSDYQKLQEVSKRSNQVIQKVMDSKKTPALLSLLYGAMETFQKLQTLQEEKEAMEEDYSIEKEMDYSKDRIDFACHYYPTPQMLDRFLWYYGTEEDKPDLENVLDMMIKQENNIIPLRNVVLGIDYNLSIREKDLLFMVNKEFLESMIQIRLGHYFFVMSRQIYIALYQEKDLKTKIPAIFLYMELVISTFRDMLRELGLDFNTSPYEPIIQKTKQNLLTFPNITEYPEIIDGLDHLFENADKISTMYQKAGQK